LTGLDTFENVIGGAGNDVLSGNLLDNTLTGGYGNDRYVFDADVPSGADRVIESDDATFGSDTIDFSPTGGIVVTFNLAVALPQEIGANLAVTLSSGNAFENIIGGTLGDTLMGNALDNRLTGGTGVDKLIGGDGTDTVVETRDANMILQNTSLSIGSESNSLAGIEQAELTGGAGLNVLDASAFGLGPVVLDGGLGNDDLRGSASPNDRVIATHDANMTLNNTSLIIGPDTDVINSIETATLTGGSGGNILNAGPFTLGPVILDGLGGADTLRGGAGNDRLTGGAGDDTVDGGGGVDRVLESRDADFTLVDGFLFIGFEGNALSNIEEVELNGGAGSNALDASGFTLGPVILKGGSGNDSLAGGARNDTLEGGPGNDVYSWDTDLNLGADKVIESTSGGSDTFNFGATTTLGVNVDLGSSTIQTINANLKLDLSNASVENWIGGEKNDSVTGNSLNNLLAGGLGDDIYLFLDGWATDTVLEFPGGGADTFNFSVVANGISVNAGATLVVTDGSGSVTHLGQAIETIIGTSHDDIFSVTPSNITTFTFLGGSGAGDVLNYDAQNLSVIQTNSAVTAFGRQPVNYSDFDAINISNSSSLTITLANFFGAGSRDPLLRLASWNEGWGSEYSWSADARLGIFSLSLQTGERGFCDDLIGPPLPGPLLHFVGREAGICLGLDTRVAWAKE